MCCSCVPRAGLGCSKPPSNSEGPPKSCQTQPDLWKLLKTAEFRTPTPQDVPKKDSKILKLTRFAIFTLAMENKLVVIINTFKVPKIKKMLLYEMKFLVSNYSCLQNSWVGAIASRSPFSLSSVLNWICWTPRTKFLGTPLVCFVSANRWGICLTRSSSKLHETFLLTAVHWTTKCGAWREHWNRPTGERWALCLHAKRCECQVMLVVR